MSSASELISNAEATAVMNLLRRLLTASVLSVLLASCSTAPYPTCTGDRATHPDGLCTAYYYQTDYGEGGTITQAMTDCKIKGQRLGGNVVAFDSLDHGIGLRWIDASTLEVAVPPDVQLQNRRMGDTYLGHALTYKYRTLEKGDSEYAGCGLRTGSN